MVVDDVENDREPRRVRRLDELLQRLGTAVGRADGEQVRGVVAPGAVARKFGDWHQLQGIDAEPPQMAEAGGDRIQRGGRRVVGPVVAEGADMHLVNHQLVPGRHGEIVARPVELRIGDDAVAGGMRDLARIRIHAREISGTGLQREAVFLSDPRSRHFRVPVPFPFRCHRVRRLAPVVEVADHRDRFGVGRPHAEGNAAVMDHGAHSRP